MTEQKPNASLFPVGFAIYTDIDVFEIGDVDGGEIADHTVGVFGGDTGVAVDDSLDVAADAIKVEIDFADGADWEDGFYWRVAEIAEIGFGLADVFFHATREMRGAIASVFVNNFDSGRIWDDDGD